MHIIMIFPPIASRSRSYTLKLSVLITFNLSLVAPHMMESVRQYDGIIFSIPTSKSPRAQVSGITLRTPAIIARIPAKTKCINMVMFYAKFSLVKQKDVTYVKGITPRGKSRNIIQT